MTFIVGVSRSRDRVVVVHRETKRRFDVTPWNAADIARDDGTSYVLTYEDQSVGITEQDVAVLRSDINAVLKYVDCAQ